MLTRREAIDVGALDEVGALAELDGDSMAADEARERLGVNAQVACGIMDVEVCRLGNVGHRR
ncbi:MAG TPA: hypothetical protein VFS30_13110 [Dehalococcoidia bacterium]|nr:hypothetical protein [Dehalococcoidia bacterium]